MRLERNQIIAGDVQEMAESPRVCISAIYSGPLKMNSQSIVIELIYEPSDSVIYYPKRLSDSIIGNFSLTAANKTRSVSVAAIHQTLDPRLHNGSVVNCNPGGINRHK